MGLFIPADTGRKVMYGHPYETVNAEQEKAQVQTFFKEGSLQDQEKFLADNKIDYIFWGPREKALGTPIILNSLKMAYQNGDVVIFQVDSQQ
jgi:hypothetical protein